MVQPCGVVNTADANSNEDIDIFGMPQSWGLADATTHTSELAMATMPLGDYSPQPLQNVTSPPIFPSSQGLGSQNIRISNRVSAQECCSDYGTQVQYLAPKPMSQVDDWNSDAQITNDCGIIGISAQANQCGPFLENDSTHFPQESPAERTMSSPNFADPVSFDCFSNSLTQRRQPHIPESARKFLEQQFSMNAYPSPAEIDALAVLTKQEPPRIKNWFSNARARRPVPSM